MKKKSSDDLYREYGLHLDVMEKGLIEEDVPQQGANSNWLYRTQGLIP